MLADPEDIVRTNERDVVPIPRFEVPAGAVDGSNQIFTVSVPYGAGTIAVFLNGMLMRADYDDGWVEANPASGQVEMKQAPLVSDVVQIFFIDTSPQGIESEVTPIRGTIEVAVDVDGALAVEDRMTGELDVGVDLAGLLVDETLLGTFEPEADLSGRLFFLEVP